MNLEIIDIIYIIIILIMAFYGFKKGFFSQLFTIVGLIVGLFIAYFFSDDLSAKLTEWLGGVQWNNLISFILLFVVFFALCQLLNKVFKNSLVVLGAQGIDKIFGFIFGSAQGLIIVIGVTFLLTAQPLFDPTPIFENSTIGNWTLSVIPTLEKIYPDTKDFIDNKKDA